MPEAPWLQRCSHNEQKVSKQPTTPAFFSKKGPKSPQSSKDDFLSLERRLVRASGYSEELTSVISDDDQSQDFINYDCTHKECL